MDRWIETNMIQVFIVNYESLKKYMVESITKDDEGKWTLRNVKFNRKINLFKSVIIDEAHKCKDFKTQATKFTKGVCQGKEYILALTGTPVVNKPKDLMPQLGIIDRLNDLGGYKNFKARYCGGANEASNLKELNWKLNNTCFFSRNKEDVLKDLPAKMRQVVMCEIDDKHRHEYNECLADLGSYLAKYNEASDEQIQRSLKGEVMVRIGKLKDISARGKLAGGVREFIEETIYDNQEKLVLFAHQHKVFDQLHAWFPEAVTVTGRDTMEERQKSIDAFQNDPKCKLILCSIQAAGVGITLTASSRVSFVELGWHSAIHDQAEDRCHRIGQVDSVQCTYFIGKDTIDEWVFELIEKKRSMVADITGGNLDAVQTSVVEDIIHLFNKKQEAAA
jgi:SWI/SNF-related matrix-associated actin-dependent regulator 1 of chromatin subfamily A